MNKNKMPKKIETARYWVDRRQQTLYIDDYLQDREGPHELRYQTYPYKTRPGLYHSTSIYKGSRAKVFEYYNKYFFDVKLWEYVRPLVVDSGGWLRPDWSATGHWKILIN